MTATPTWKALSLLALAPLACVPSSDSVASKDRDAIARQAAESAGKLARVADSIVLAASSKLRSDVDSLMTVKRSLGLQVAEIEESRAQVLRGLPGTVSLDSVNAYYVSKWNEAGFSEAFETAAGNISFWKSDFSFAYVPSSRAVAYIRIGKNDDGGTSREIIRAWLKEAAELKIRLGYSKSYQRSGPAEYGDYTEALYRKGDAYLKTYFRQSRVQGTYGRFSLEYDYYIEFGSAARADRYKLETLNSRIGS